MPEGDTVHRNARVLSREIQGRTLARFYVRDRGDVVDLVGRVVDRIEARGKQLLVHISDGWILRVHLGMKGKWIRRHVRERPPAGVTALLAVDDTAYICVGAFTAELLREEALRTHPVLARLGPDLLADPPDITAAVQRAMQPAYATREIGDVLMDQRVAAGIGNVYKSEVLFECRMHPRTRMHHITPEKMTELYERAAHLMRLNLLTRRRTAVPLRRRSTPSSQRLWVYMRAGKPCLDCGTHIERFMQGDMNRSTYFCPRCQASATDVPGRAHR